MSTSPDVIFAHLHALGAGEFAHLNGSLVAHLRGTESLLREWGANDTLCAAGLYHAVYGTEGYQPSLAGLDMRQRIAELIGTEAEQLVYLYGACHRRVFYPRIGTPDQLAFSDRFCDSEYTIMPEQLGQLCEIILANELEIARGSPAFRAEYGGPLSELFERMRGLVSEAGLRAAHKILT